MGSGDVSLSVIAVRRSETPIGRVPFDTHRFSAHSIFFPKENPKPLQMKVCKLERHCRVGPFWCSDDFDAYQKCLHENLGAAGERGAVGPVGPAGERGAAGLSAAFQMKDLVASDLLKGHSLSCFTSPFFEKAYVCVPKGGEFLLPNQRAETTNVKPEDICQLAGELFVCSDPQRSFDRNVAAARLERMELHRQHDSLRNEIIEQVEKFVEENTNR